MIVSLTYFMATCQPADLLAPRWPTPSLLSSTTIWSVVGFAAINLMVLLSCLGLMARQSDYVRWPSTYADGGERWWELVRPSVLFCGYWLARSLRADDRVQADGWESTVMLFCFSTQLCTASLIFSMGDDFREPLWAHWRLCSCWAAFMGFFGWLLLFPFDTATPPTVVHAVFHIASIAFNSNTTQSPVWKAWQEDGGGMPSPGMPLALRVLLAAALLAGFVVASLFEKYIVLGRIARGRCFCCKRS